MDCTDFRGEFGTKKAFFSYKINGPGLRYELGLSILNGDIVWISGPFAPGKWPDINIFRRGIVHYLDENERVEADDGYRGNAPSHVKCPRTTSNDQVAAMQSRVRSRHETLNERFKNWGCLRDRFRHDVNKHAASFRAIAVVLQLSFEQGERLFQVDYSDDASL